MQPAATKSMLNYYRAWFRTFFSRLPNPCIPVPTLVIWGAKDRFLGREMAEPSLDFCENGRLEFIEKATHWVQHEKPERVNRLIVEFLSCRS
jgi:pimeloyl-ACP methyl ester carboxylesterase